MTKLEQVARAMAIVDGKDPDDPAWIRYPGGHTEGICWRDQYAGKARAAVEALMEPTEEMKAVGCIATGEAMTFNTVEGVYQAMLRNILEEGDE